MTSYQKLLLDYAEVLQFYSYSGPLIYKVLEDKRSKYDQHAQNNPRMIERYDFWAKVTDIFMSNSRYMLFETFKQGEYAAKNDPEYIRKIIYLKQKRHTLPTLWFNAVPEIEQYVYYILKANKELKEMREAIKYEADFAVREKKTKELGVNLFATKSALYPCMQGYMNQKDKTQYFKYLPLLQWSIENLFYYGRYSAECDPFIRKVVIPVFRLHLQYANEFLGLIHREEDMYSASNLFVDDIKFNSEKELKEDAPYCEFSEALLTALNMQDYTALNKSEMRLLKSRNLLYSIYRIEKLVDIFDVPNYFHTISVSDLDRALNAVNHVVTVFSVENIKAVLINRIYSLATSPDFYDQDIFNETYAEVMQSIENLMHINILSVTDKAEIMKEIDRPVRLRKEIIINGGAS